MAANGCQGRSDIRRAARFSGSRRLRGAPRPTRLYGIRIGYAPKAQGFQADRDTDERWGYDVQFQGFTMPEFDLSKVPAEIAKLLMSRGSGTPPLQWTAHQNLLAKKTLDQTDDPFLFGGAEIRNLGMASTVRGLLYLYAGWPAEACKFAALAGPPEHPYIAGLCERHLGHVGAAKEWFKKLGRHALFVPLGERVAKLLRTETEPPLKRFREIVELDKAWEPFAFVDLYEQTRAGRLSPLGEQLVCRLQLAEFETLFGYCFRSATGRSIDKHQVMSEAEEQRRLQEYRRRLTERREREERQRKVVEAKKAAKAEQNKPKEPPPPRNPKVKVLCPKCGTLVYVAESLRGKPAQCVKCAALFRVPQKKASDENAAKYVSPGF